MGNKNSNKRPLNILKIPIYAIGSYGDYVFLGGGGGYEIENKIEVYQLENPSQNILKKLVHEEPCGDGVPNYFELPNHNLNILTACVFAKVAFYKIDVKSGVNINKILELPGHYEPINAVDFSPDKKLLISSSTDKSCIIFNLEKRGQKVQKLTFNDGLTSESKNMLMRGCFFSNDGKFIYTLATQTRSKSYLIKWQNKENFDPVKVTLVHNQTSSGMRISPNGNDGYVKVMNEGSENFIVEQKRHRLPVTCMGFKTDFSGKAEYVLSGSPDYTYNIISCNVSIFQRIMGLIRFLLILMIIVGVVIMIL